ncbi:MAG TPA: F0F1 ATP synthase subunit epsilon [Nitrospiria bacterium]|nr:F0F1 ATP synthase subunit epsilon [Nitrospiria bacterium]
MSGKIHLDIVTPDRLIISEEVDEIVAPGTLGDFGVLPGHAPFFSTLRIGELSYRKADQTHFMAISWGFAQVYQDKVIVLAEIAEKLEEIDLLKVSEAIARAEGKILSAGDNLTILDEARTSLEKAMNRKAIAERNPRSSSGR